MVIVENIPEDVSLPHNGTTPLTAGLHSLLDLATRHVEIVSPHWTLNSTDYESSIPTAKQVAMTTPPHTHTHTEMIRDSRLSFCN